LTFGGMWGSMNGGAFTHEFGDSAPVGIRVDSVSAAPEPGTWALPGCGLLAVVSRRRRK